MPTYDLFLESGPRKRKTMVHVLGLLGCVATGPTTDDAVAAAPDAIAAYHRFLKRCGESVPRGKVQTRVAQHITEGKWLGNGSPYFMFDSDYDPVDQADIDRFLTRFHHLRAALSTWAAKQSDADLDAEPDQGRTARAILLHVLAPPGPVLSTTLDGVTGFSRVERLTERGEIPLPEALLQVEELAAARIRATTTDERTRVVQRPQDERTLRKAIRRILEHDWEHLAELARRPGGPKL